MPPRLLGHSAVRRGWVAALAGLVGLGATAGPTAPAAADPSGYRPTATAPAAWLSFAERARAALADRLAADDAATEPLRRRIAEQRAPAELVVQIWVSPRGTVARVVVEDVDTGTAALVQALIGTVALGTAPPPDMAQPVRLKLAVAAKG